MAKRITIAAARRLAAEFGLRQVILIGLNEEDDTAHVVTYGKTAEDCRLAAESGNNLKRHMGWPEELCSAVPARAEEEADASLTASTIPRIALNRQIRLLRQRWAG